MLVVAPGSLARGTPDERRDGRRPRARCHDAHAAVRPRAAPVRARMHGLQALDHHPELRRPFLVGKQEVTFAEFKRTCWPLSEIHRAGRHPGQRTVVIAHQPRLAADRAVVRGTAMKRFSQVHSALLGCVAVCSARRHTPTTPRCSPTARSWPPACAPTCCSSSTPRASHGYRSQCLRRRPRRTSGPCPAGRVYWRPKTPACPRRLARRQPSGCPSTTIAAARPLRHGNASGWWRGRTQMLIKTGNPYLWGNAFAGRDWKLECRNDHDVHGDLPGTTAPGARTSTPVMAPAPLTPIAGATPRPASS